MMHESSIEELKVFEKVIPKRNAIYEEFPDNLSKQIRDFLMKRGIERLYCHQADMFQTARRGENVVITTSTASGKTLSFLLPVLQEILEKPLTRAIFIYPTKALAADQYRAILPYIEYFGENRISAGVYDGDTPTAERSRIRKSANIILTNPEMINGAFLPNHSKYGFDFIFSNLKYIVIDELHTYRGAFGSHLSNLFRRMDRICKYYHASPQFLCSSATIANPIEHAGNICHRDFTCINNDGAPCPEKKYVFLQPPKIMGKDNKYYGQIQATTVAAEILPALMDHEESFIAFTKSRRNVEVILKETRDQIEAEGFLGHTKPDKISGYRGGYSPIERKTIENKMVNGELLGLVSTNALELGIDIGTVKNTVLVGYPGTRASFWQQTGRAGRSKESCTNYLILEQNPFDQYISIDPGYLFHSESENAVIDPDNLLIQLAHIRAAAAEIPLSLDDISMFKDLGEAIPVLLNMGEVRNQNGKFAWNGGVYPAGDISMRNIDENQYKLICMENGREITRMDESQAFREIHQGAVYMHDGISYQVVKLDLESRTAYANPFQGNFYTIAAGETNIDVIHSIKEEDVAKIHINFGDVNVKDFVYMYKKLQFHNHQNLGFEKFLEPLKKQYDTESVWLTLPERIGKVFRGLLMPDTNGIMVRNNHFEGLCFALKNAALMVTMTEQNDIGVVTSQNATELSDILCDEIAVYFYDCYVGGLGFSEKIYENMEKIIHQAIKMVSLCKCEDGCAACVGDYHLDKRIVKWGLENLLEESEPPKGYKIVNFAPGIVRKKEFDLQNINQKWDEFCKLVERNGESFSAFFKKVNKITVVGECLTCYLDNMFMTEWARDEINYRNLVNIIKYYVETSIDFKLEIKAIPKEEDDSRKKQDKMYRRYQS